MSMVFCVSDNHFCHSNIIHYAQRPFLDVEEMNEYMVKAWNSVVLPEDTVWHLGDFGFGKVEKLRAIFDRLNGGKKLILGNHDSTKTRMEKVGFTEIHKFHQIEHGGKIIWLIHNPEHIRTRHSRHFLEDLEWVFYGHVHNTVTEYATMPRWVNCCVESWEYKPVPIEMLIEKGMK